LSRRVRRDILDLNCAALVVFLLLEIRSFCVCVYSTMLADQTTNRRRDGGFLGGLAYRRASGKHRIALLILGRHRRILDLSWRRGARSNKFDNVGIFAQPTVARDLE
jgi:hypothetical protein